MYRRLAPRPIERIWGRRDLPAWAVRDIPAHTTVGTGDDDAAIGEIWFEEPGGADRELLVKLLFTGERLSIQVHPDDKAARAIGHKRGKEEAWLVLEAEPDAVIGLGLRREVSREELRAAALSGAIEELINWRPVVAGEVYYSPSGTVHAIGAGLTIMEIQQNLDLTYRLYDYGRPRELHLDEGIAAADPGPWRAGFQARELAPGRELLHAGGAFVLERWTGDPVRTLGAPDEGLWLIPFVDGGTLDGAPLRLGAVYLVVGEARLAGDARLIAAYPGMAERPGLIA